MQRLLVAARTPYHLAIATGLFAGLRVGESLGLASRDIDTAGENTRVRFQMSRDGERQRPKTAAASRGQGRGRGVAVLDRAREGEGLVGTPLVEALHALAARGDLRPGDTISVYSASTARRSGPSLVGINNPAAQEDAVIRALDRMAANGLLPDGKDGRPSLRGIRVVAPIPSARVKVSHRDDERQEAARQVVAQQFWEAWADRVGVELVWGKPAGGSR